MWPDRRLCELLGLEHPIIQAPMAGSSTHELAAAVSEAGGLGSLGCAGMTLAQIEDATTALRRRSNRPFNLNFFAHNAKAVDPAVFHALRERLTPWYRKLGAGEPPTTWIEPGPGFDAAKLELVLRLRHAVVSFHFGVPDGDAITALKRAGIRLLSTASRISEARALEKAGMDAIIAQGWEAGGHRGSHEPTLPHDGVGTLALVPQVVDAVKLPVIAAGGIGDGRGIVAALALGASGVQMGTAFLLTPEAATDEPRRVLLRQAADTDTMVTDAVSGRAARAFRSLYALDMEAQRGERLPYGAMYGLTNPLTGAGQDAEASFHLYGQAAALAVEHPAADVMARLVADSRAALKRLASG